MSQEQTAKMARSYSQALGQKFDTAVTQPGLTYQAQSTSDRALRSRPSWRAWRALGAATETWAKSRFCRRRSRGIVTNILFLGCRRRTDGTAIHPTGKHGNEELAVESRIA